MKSVRVKVPGKVMLAGEYAVLRGGAAMACTISHNMHVSVEASKSSWEAHSDLLGQKIAFEVLDSKDPRCQEPLYQILLRLKLDYPSVALSFRIESDLKVSYGVGSSSALRFGCLLAAKAYLSKDPLSPNDAWDAARAAFDLQRHAQTFASGYDIATQCKGGLTVMRNPGGPTQWPGLIAHMAAGPATLNRYSLILVGGRGAPTGSLTASTLRWLDQHQQWDHLNEVSEDLIDAWTSLITSTHADQQLPALIRSVAKHRNFFSDSPAAAGGEIVQTLRTIPGFDNDWTCKTTGAGGEDAMLLVGPIDTLQQIAAKLAPHGWLPAPFNFIERAAIVEASHE